MKNYIEKTDLSQKSVRTLFHRVGAFIMAAVMVFLLTPFTMASAVNSVNKFSTPYKNSIFYVRLNKAKNKTYADAGKKLAAIAESQLSYKEGLNYQDLDGYPATYKNLSYKAGSTYKNYKGYLDACEYNFWYYGCSDNSAVSKYASSTKKVKGAKYPVSNYNKAWCAVFVSWCAAQAGLSKKVPASASAGMLGFHKYKKKGIALKNGVKAIAASARRPGDLVYYYCKKCKATSHVGIVSTNVSYSIEGNTNDGVSKVNLTKAVSNKCMSGHKTERFYLRPNIYTSSNSSSTTTPVINSNTDKFTISYNTNGGSGTFASQTKKRGVAIKLHNSPTSKEGYVFAGWKSSSDSVVYQPGQSYTKDASTTLTAVWKKKPITWKSVYVKDVTTNSAFVGCTVTADCSKLSRIGLQLKEGNGAWKTVASWKVGSVLNYCTVQCGGTNSEIGGNLKSNTSYQYRFYVQTTNVGTLYSSTGSFKTNPALKGISVYYNTNGGSGTFISQAKIPGTALTIHKDKPTKAGYVFMGWKSSSDSVTYQPGASYTKDASTTLTAVWVKNPITFKTMYVKNITATSAFVGCTVDADCSKINRIGLQLKENGGSWKVVASWKVGNVLDYCTVQCGGPKSEIKGNLKRNTNYQYRFYVETTNCGTLYTTIRNFTTKA